MKKTPFYGNRLSGGRGGDAQRFKAVLQHTQADETSHGHDPLSTLTCSEPLFLALTRDSDTQKQKSGHTGPRWTYGSSVDTQGHTQIQLYRLKQTFHPAFCTLEHL